MVTHLFSGRVFTHIQAFWLLLFSDYAYLPLRFHYFPGGDCGPGDAGWPQQTERCVWDMIGWAVLV